MNQKILIMYVNPLDIPAKDGRKEFKAVQAEYFFFGEEGELLQPKINVEGECGMRRGKSNLDPEIESKVSYIPGIYDGTFEMAVDSKGHGVLKLVDISFIAKARITAMEDKAAK